MTDDEVRCAEFLADPRLLRVGPLCQSKTMLLTKTARFLLPAMLLLGSSAAAQTLRNSYHHDHRSGLPKLEFFQEPVVLRDAAKGEAAARRYLTENARRYGIADASDFRLARVQHSLIGSHYRFQQYLDDYPVRDAEVVVSLNATSGVYMVANSSQPVGPRARRGIGPSISAQAAMDSAWGELRVHGGLLAEPQRDLAYVVDDGAFHLCYLVRYGLEAPFGYWEVQVDAQTGQALTVRSLSMDRKRLGSIDFRSYEGPMADRRTELRRFRQRQPALRRSRAKMLREGVRADGSALVFDPDPVTTLRDDTLEDDSPPERFDAAYVQRDLRDLLLFQGLYRLDGPWVKLVDQEAPATVPSTSATGQWTAKRGDSAFDDAMVYFHLDANQRYVQSLGFVGDLGLQQLAIPVDSDGFDGADNSHFVPAFNRLAFGQGCVNDTEDAFVILHEYNHALMHDIIPTWTQGDAGGLSEGFADYWASVLRISAADDDVFHPEWAFPWDGHNECWDGRRLDRTDLIYDPSATYTAHGAIDDPNLGIAVADELWSAPLVAALRDLLDQGIPRREVDRVLLQGHFGLTGDARMPEAAASIVLAAKILYPEGPHASVLLQKFVDQEILETPEETPIKELYLSYYRIDPVDFTGIAVFNPSASDAGVALTALQADGTPQSFQVNPSAFFLAAGRQRARVVEELFAAPFDFGSVGWIRLTTDNPDIGVFAQTGSRDGLSLDGAVAIDAVFQRLFFTRVLEGSESFRGRPARTILTLVNPHPEAIDVLLTLREASNSGAGNGSAETLPASTQRTIASRGFVSGTIEELFGVSEVDGWIQADVESRPGILGFAWIEVDGVRTVLGLNAGGLGAATRLFSAQFAAQSDLFSSLRLINASDETRTVTVTAVSESGTVVGVALERNLQALESMTLDAGTDFGEASFVGTLQVDADGPGVIGDVVFGDPVAGDYAAAAPLRSEALTRAVFGQVANLDEFFTGLAFFNPGAVAADTTVRVHRADGSLVGMASLRIEPGHRLSRLIPELVPASANQTGGYIVVESTQPLVCQQLFGAVRQGKIKVLSSVPPSP